MKRLFLFLVLCTTANATNLPKWLILPTPDVAPPTEVSEWVLYDDLTITQEDATTVVRRHRRAVMVLSDAAVQSTLCFEQYVVGLENLVSAKAWVTSPDGKKSRAFGGSEFLTYSPRISEWTWDQTTSAYFNPRRYLQPGWIFAWEVEIRSKYGAFDFNWTPECSLPVRFASLEIRPMTDGEVKWKTNSNELSCPVAGSSPGAVRWSLSDIPAYKGNVPNDMDRESKKVRAYTLAPHNQKTLLKTWGDVVRLASAQIDPQKISSPSLEAIAKQLAASGNMWERIAPICRFVQKEIAYLSITIFTDSMAGYRPHTACEVLENRYGDCKDKALLLCAMLQTVGVEARLMLVNYDSPKYNSIDWPSAQFNHAIVAIRASEHGPAGWPRVQSEGIDYVLFDPTDDRVPLGMLPFRDTGGLGLVLAPSVTAPVEIPSASAPTEAESVIVNYALAEDGSAVVECVEERSGLSAISSINEDETTSFAERTDALERRIRRRTPLISELTWQSSNDPKSHLWKRTAHFKAEFVIKPISRTRSLVTPDLLSEIPSLEPWEEGSSGWFSLAPKSLRREIHLNLPLGWEIAEMPPAWSAKNGNGEATVCYRREGASLIGEIQLVLKGGVLDRPAYLEARKLLRDTVSAERRPVVMTRIAPTKVAAPDAKVSP